MKFCPFCGSHWLGGCMGHALFFQCSDCKERVPRRMPQPHTGEAPVAPRGKDEIGV